MIKPSDWQSETWEWLGTLNKLVEFGFDPIAIDIPGRGLSVGKALRKVFTGHSLLRLQNSLNRRKFENYYQ